MIGALTRSKMFIEMNLFVDPHASRSSQGRSHYRSIIRLVIIVGLPSTLGSPRCVILSMYELMPSVSSSSRKGSGVRTLLPIFNLRYTEIDRENRILLQVGSSFRNY